MDGTMFECRHNATGIELEMTAAYASVDLADAAITAHLEEAGARLDLFAVRILLREALLNAVEHGSGGRPDATVRCTVALDERGLRLVVDDDGPGFTWHDREAELEILGDGGRGIPIMQVYASEMHYNDAGNRLELRRDYEPVPQEGTFEEAT
jgi:serine/threonine-protein kinase RsbW